MEFRLVYQGALPGSGNSSRHAAAKHQIRKRIHSQLAELWCTHPLLAILKHRYFDQPKTAFVETWLERYSRQIHGLTFLPLVHERLDQICGLDILLLRREKPGGLITQGGDVDNRVKTLFDALSIPDSTSGVTPPEANEVPFFCLMEKDKLVTQVRVTADRLWTPAEQTEPQNYVHAVIGVKIQVAMEFKWAGQTYTRR